MRSKLLIIFCFIMLTSNGIHAQNYSVSLTSGTMGIGIEGMRSFGPGYAARAGFAGISYSRSGYNGADYIMDADLTLSSISILADWFPFKGVFHFTYGLIYNINEAEATLTPSESHNVGGRIYTPEKIGNLTAKVGFNKIAPYLGIGYREGNTSGLGFTFDAGLFYHGYPHVDLTASGLLEPSTEQAPIIEDNIKWFSFFPVISFGLTYTF